MTPGQTDSAASGCNVQAYPRVDLHRNAAKRANPRFCPLYRHCGAWHDAMPGLLAKKEKMVFFLLCGKQAKINALIFLFLLCFIHPVCERMGFASRLSMA
jgi:hypothetical protein